MYPLPRKARKNELPATETLTLKMKQEAMADFEVAKLTLKLRIMEKTKSGLTSTMRIGNGILTLGFSRVDYLPSTSKKCYMVYLEMELPRRESDLRDMLKYADSVYACCKDINTFFPLIDGEYRNRNFEDWTKPGLIAPAPLKPLEIEYLAAQGRIGRGPLYPRIDWDLVFQKI